MSKSLIHTHSLANGITILAEEMDFVSSAAYSILIPSGAAVDPDGAEGTSNLLCDMFSKGAGKFNAKELSQQFEDLGAHKGASVGMEASVFSGALLGTNLSTALRLHATMLRQPTLPAAELESVRQLALLELRSLEDRPASKVMVELAKNYYPHPFGRSTQGTVAGVQAVTPESLKEFYQKRFVPDGAIIGIAGRFDWPKVKATLEECFGDWQGSNERLPKAEVERIEKNIHIAQDTSQLQIAIAHPSVGYGDDDYYVAKVLIGVLSGGMSGRLFIEVREKRGLVYRVSASHSGTIGRSAVFTYAGTTPENGQECLDVIAEEYRKLIQGISEEELQRAKADLKSRIIMQGEHSSVRASSLVNDWWNLGRIRSLDEIKQGIEVVTDADIRSHVEKYPASPRTMVTLGPKGLELR